MGITPAVGAGTPREDLVGAYYEYDPSLDGFQAFNILAPQSVNKRVGTYGVIPAAEYLRRINTIRAPKGATSRSDFGTSSDTFALVEFTTEQACPLVLGDIFEDWLDQEEEATRMNALHIARDIEAVTMAAAFNTTTLPADNITGKAAAAVWSSRANADPIGDVETGRLAVSKYKSRRPNAMLINEATLTNLAICDQLKNRCTQMYGRVVEGALPEESIKAILRLDHLFVGRATYDANPPGAATSDIQYHVPSDQALLFHYDPSRPRSPQLGMMLEPAKQMGVIPDSYMEPQTKSNVVRLTRHCQPKIHAHPAAYRITTLV